jgi:hypothetical protein
MDHNINNPKWLDSRLDRDPSIEYIHSTFASLSEPEEDDTSDVQSFDEDDMYGSDIGNDIVVTVPESEDAVQSFDEDTMHSSDIGNSSVIMLSESEDDFQTSSDDVILTLLASVDNLQASLIEMVSHLSFRGAPGH